MTIDKHTFLTYPFPKHLLVDIKLGYYKVIGEEGKEEVLEADNAKDALSKSGFKEVKKIIYLGFSSKLIVDAAELIEDHNYVPPTSAPIEEKTATVAQEPNKPAPEEVKEAAPEEPKEAMPEEPKPQEGSVEQ